jgi:hypothetical protein
MSYLLSERLAGSSLAAFWVKSTTGRSTPDLETMARDPEVVIATSAIKIVLPDNTYGRI